MATTVSPSPLLPPPSSSSSKIQPEAPGRAVDALRKWSKSRTEDQKPQLLEQDDFFYLILTLKKIPPKGRTNPYKIPLPHSLHPMDASEELCLIIDDRSKSSLTSEDAKKKIKAEDIPISKVLKLSKLKTDYRPFEAKRKLCDSYNMFFADKRIIPLLPKLLGKQFFKKKKIPVPVELTHKNWKEQIERASGSALLYLRTGTCSVIKVGKVSQSRDELIENMIAAIEGIAEIVPKKWANIRSLHLKMSESLALPIYQAVPDMGLKIEGVKKSEEIKGEAEPMEEGGTEEKKKKLGKKKVSKKGRIHEVRYMDDDVPGEVLDAIADVVLDDVDEDEKIENVELGSAEFKGKKRKKAEKSKKERVLDGSNEKKVKKPAMIKKGDAAKQERVIDGSNEKQLKKPANVKKVEAVKQKDILSSEKLGTPSSTELKKNKKKSKSGTLESGEKKMKSKKNRTKPMA